MAARSEGAPAKAFDPPAEVVRRVMAPSDADAEWLTEALEHDERKWFVAELAGRATPVAEAFFVPLMDAAIDEVDPSFNRYFVEPCVKAFGPRRVNEYLLEVVEAGPDFCKAGAVNALYWAQVPLSFRGDAPAFTMDHATPESRAAYEALADLWERKRTLLLKTFVSNSSLDLRRSIIPSLDLDLDPLSYSESHRPLVAQAIAIARHHEDYYIRHRVELQLGKVKTLLPLPHRRHEGGQRPLALSAPTEHGSRGENKKWWRFWRT